MNQNRILPPGSQFDAVVDGKPTSLAGCTRSDCERAQACLRAQPGLSYRDDMARGQQPAACGVFILAGKA